MGRGVDPAACWGTAPWLLSGGDGGLGRELPGVPPAPGMGQIWGPQGEVWGGHCSHLGCRSRGESVTALTQAERR